MKFLLWGVLTGGLAAAGYWGYKLHQRKQKKESFKKEDIIRTKLEVEKSSEELDKSDNMQLEIFKQLASFYERFKTFRCLWTMA